MKRRYPDMLAVFRRELKAYFTSPLGYVFVGLFVLISAVFFAITNLLSGNPNFTSVLGTISFIFLFLVPLLTMRLLSEEMKQKTDQLLITSPLSVTAIVVGKYLAAFAVFLITLLITFLFPIIMSFFALMGLGWAEVVGGYVGFLLMGAAFISIGLFFSSVTDNQLTAALETFAALLMIWILDYVSQSVPSDSTAGLVFMAVLGAALVAVMYFSTRNLYVAGGVFVVAGAAIGLVYGFDKTLFEGLIAKLLSGFSLVQRYNDFSMGLLGLSPIVYYITFTGAFVFLTIRMVEKRRWV
jgi:ABC-2 type transport system permease protein